jgi:hypothetical protein
MRGYAGMVSALTTGLIDEQQSFLMRHQGQRARLENQRRAFDNWQHFRDNMPTIEDDRERDLALQVRRALYSPPEGEVYSGRALNVLLDDLCRQPGKEPALHVALKLDDVVGRLNFTGQENKGNPALLKFVSTENGQLPWPSGLADPRYDADRDLLNRLARTVYKEAERGRVDAGHLDSMGKTARKLQLSLADNIRDLTPSQYGEARRFLGDLEDLLILLGQPNASQCFGARAPKAEAISDLVQEMLNRGLRFAPATVGDEAAYLAVHRALVMYALNAKAAE